MLDAGVAVDDHVHVHLEQRAAFGHDHHLRLARGLEHLLALVAARLVVALDADRAGRLQPLQMGEGVVQAVDHRGEVAFRAVQHRAGREDPRPHHAAGALHLGLGVDVAGAVGRVVQRGEAEGQRGVVDPALLRDDFALGHRAVPVGVDQAGDHRLAGGLDRLRARRDRHRGAWPDRRDAVAVDQDDAVLDDFIGLGRVHRDDARADDGDAALRLVGAQRQLDRRAALGRLEARLQRLRQRHGEQLVAERVVQRVGPRLAVARPLQVVAGIDVELADGHRLGLGADGLQLAGRRERRHVGVEAFGEAQPLAVRRHGEARREFALGDRDLAAFDEVQADQLAIGIDLAGGLLAGDVERVVVGAELRRLAVLGDAARLALAIGRCDVDAGLQAVPGRGQVAALGLLVRDAAAVGREGRRQVLAGLRRDDGVAAAGQVEHAHAALVGVAPAEVDQLAAIAREGREVFEALDLRGQAPGFADRLAVAQLARVEVARGREHHSPAVGRDLHPAQHLRFEAGRRDLMREAHRGRELALVLHVEGDFGGRALERIDAPELALRPGDELAGIGCPGDAGVDAMHGPGLLQVALHAGPGGELAAGLQVLEEQRGAAARRVAQTADEGEVLAVGRGCGTDRAAGAGDEGLAGAVGQVLAVDPEDLAGAVLVVFELAAGRAVLRVVEELAIGRERGLAEVLLPVRLLVELLALAAVEVIEPDLAAAQ